jgi:outer membrane protein assembly factor BamE
MILPQFSLIDNPMKNHLVILVLALMFVVGCSAYRPDIRQGNVLEPAQINKLQLGMTQKQVIFLLGSPLLQDPFHRNRWDYIYTLQKPDEPMQQQRLTLYFANDALEKIDASQLEIKPLDK